jgi:hydrogenase maturation protein HypF
VPARLQLCVSGTVQGVGFRPFVHRLACELALGGWVQNRSGTVWIELDGEDAALAAFCVRVIRDAPPLAQPQIQHHHSEPLAMARRGFAILPSSRDEAADIHLPADTHLCEDCRRELFDPQDRRYRYPFINCTQCGPRYTLIAGLPYDRPRTSMAAFPLCPACEAEYRNPDNRRFHAEPIACPACGPQLAWRGATTAAREAALESKLQQVNPLLAKLDQELAAALYKSFRTLAQETAKASGGFLRIGAVGSAESRWIELPMITPIHPPAH